MNYQNDIDGWIGKLSSLAAECGFLDVIERYGYLYKENVESIWEKTPPDEFLDEVMDSYYSDYYR